MNAALPKRTKSMSRMSKYLRHGDKALLARVYKPQGAGPFPLCGEVGLLADAWSACFLVKRRRGEIVKIASIACCVGRNPALSPCVVTGF